MKKLEINSANGYLNLEDLPYNCIFNKVVTGCGGTTVVLFNNESYIIAVPTTELIVNKTGLNEAGIAEIVSPDGKRQSVFGLFGSFTYQLKKEVKEYANRDGIKKIMCTYNKVEQLVKLIDVSKFRLLVDEYHVLLKSYSYRDKAVNGVIQNFNKFKSYCFMSATPISAEFTPSVLKETEIYEADWVNGTDNLIVKLDQTNHPYSKAANYINSYKKDGFITIGEHKSYEAFFFINSVTDIAEILKYCNLSNDEVKIVCANNEENRRKLEGYTISNSRSENKKFTFITSKSFEGADYFSETGMCFVVSNSRNKNTLLDISTDIYQIAGRIRTESNPFRNLMIHIFNSVGKRKIELDITYEEMVNKVNKNIDGANQIINLINTSDNVKSIAEKMINSEYIMKNADGSYFLNDMLVKLDLYNFKLEQMIYKTGIALKKEYNKQGIITTNIEYEALEGISKSACKMDFKTAFNKYVELATSIVPNDALVEIIKKQQPLVIPAYHKLGVDKVKKLRYVKSAIENAIINLDSNKSSDIKLAKMILDKISLGFISSKRAKEIIAGAYKELKIDDSPKASNLSKWFDCKEITKKVDGKVVKGYEIYSPKFIFK